MTKRWPEGPVWTWGVGMVSGVVLGLALGLSLDNLGLGIAIGAALGIALAASFAVAETDRKKKRGDDHPPS